MLNMQKQIMKVHLNIYTVCLLATAKPVAGKITLRYTLNICISFTGKENSIGIQKGAAFLPQKQT